MLLISLFVLIGTNNDVIANPVLDKSTCVDWPTKRGKSQAVKYRKYANKHYHKNAFTTRDKFFLKRWIKNIKK